jgi:Mn-dependent DtxR family transcriptional regulator
MAPDLNLSKSQREALKAIHRITVDRRREGDRRRGARNGDLAAQLQVSPGTITAWLKALSKKGLIDYKTHKDVTLTEDGTRAAIIAIRRHRIVEAFLAATLGYSGEEADRLAPTIEHSLPAEVELRIYEQLGHPKTCPHGYSIPEPSGENLPAMETLYELYDLNKNKQPIKEQSA